MQCMLFTKFMVSLTLEETAKRVKKLGFDGADLPVRPGSQVTHENARRLLGDAVRAFREEGLAVPTIVTGIKNAADAHAEEVMATAAENGVQMLRTNSWTFRPGDNYHALLEQCRRDLASLEPLCEKHGIKANFQIHSGHCLNCNVAGALLMLQGRNPRWLGLQMDSGHLEISGEKPHMAFAMIGDYLHCVNVKSPRYYALPGERPGELRWRILWQPLPEGLVNWRTVFGILKDRNYQSPLIIHAEYPVERSIEMSSELAGGDLRYVRGLLLELGL